MARQSHIQFSIPEPCHVPWNSMSPVDDRQRHCSSCEKVITDFSKMSDDELMLYFRHSNGKTCGRFSNDQLNRRIKLLPEKTQKAHWWKTLLLIPLSFFSKSSKAQTADSLETMQKVQSLDSVPAQIEIAKSDSDAVDSVPVQNEITKNDSVVTDSSGIVENLTDTAKVISDGSDSLQVSIDVNTYPWVLTETEIGTMTSGCIITTVGDVCIGPPDNPGILAIALDSLFPNRKKKTGDQIENPNGLKQLADQPEQKPKPQEPAIPASNDLNAILPEELRKSKRA